MRTFIRELLSGHSYCEEGNRFTLTDNTVITVGKGKVEMQKPGATAVTETRLKDSLLWMKRVRAVVTQHLSTMNRVKGIEYKVCAHSDLDKLVVELFGPNVNYKYSTRGGLNDPKLERPCVCMHDNFCFEHAVEFGAELQLLENEKLVVLLDLYAEQDAERTGNKVRFTEPTPVSHTISVKPGWLADKELSSVDFRRRVRKLLCKAESRFPGEGNYQHTFLAEDVLLKFQPDSSFASDEVDEPLE